MALGALIIKEKLGISDRETVEQIQENPYLQYFIGLEVYQNDPPFDASMFVYFRKRITLDLIHQVNRRIVELQQKNESNGSPEREFGAKISASYHDGFVFLDHLSWDNFNESKDLKAQVEAFKDYTGHYPESVHVDQIYRNRENRAWCKERGIRISGPPLGRPKKSVSLEEKKQAQLDARIRNEIEGKFGQGKRRFGLNLIMTKLSNTSETAIAISFLVMNLNTLFSRGYYLLFCLFLRKRNQVIVKNYLKLLRYKQI